MEKQPPTEPSIGWADALGEHGTNPPDPIEGIEQIYGLGQWWQVPAWEQRLKAQFEKWVKHNARLTIQEAQDDGDFEEADNLRSTYQGDSGAGHYKWEGKACRSARKDLLGLVYMMFLLIRRCHKDVTEAQVEALFKENPREFGRILAWAHLGNSQPPTEEPKGETKTRKPNKTQPHSTVPTTMDLD